VNPKIGSTPTQRRRNPAAVLCGSGIKTRLAKLEAAARRHALAGRQASLNETLERRTQLRLGLARHRSQQGMGKLTTYRRPDLRAGPSRSSRAISEACKLAGTAKAGDGTAAAVRCAASSLSASSTAFVISSANRGMPSVRSTISDCTSAGSALFPARRAIMAARLRSTRRTATKRAASPR
jgi:hypothetical protein